MRRTLRGVTLALAVILAPVLSNYLADVDHTVSWQ